MKICYLILAHNNFIHLERLIEALDDESARFFIHIDKKVTGNYSHSNPHIKVIPQRININWGGFAMVEATLSLIRNAMDYVPDADYFVLISGVDYPIRPKKFLINLLSQKKEYIDIAPVPIPHKPKERYEYYYFEYDRRNIKHCNLLFLFEVLFKKFNIKRKAPFKIYAGSQWFALTRECVAYILHTVATDQRYISFFKRTLVPDEAFFHTIIGNSPFMNNTATSLTYTDWDVPVPPAIIEDKHVDLLKTKFEFNDDYGKRFPYFARKFNDTSHKIIARIRKELW